MKNAYPDSNKVIPIKEDYLGKANDLEADNKDTNFYLLSNKEYNINKSGKA
jgi:hypothetical protein